MGTAVAQKPKLSLIRPRTAQTARNLRPAAWFVGIGAALVLSRWALAPRYLVSFDEINFAFAIDHFNPVLHQPQPPGYPLFVGLLKLLSLLIPKVETVFLAAAILTSAASLFVVWKLCESIAGPGRGLPGVLLLLFHPVFWLSALANPVRLSLAFGTSLVVFCAWKACRENSTRWLPMMAAALGLAIGFRPALIIVLTPLLLWTVMRVDASWKVYALSLLCFCAALATWLPALLAASRGWRMYLSAMGGYSDSEFTATSLLFGATLPAAMKMAGNAVVWSCLGVLSWVWAVPFAVRNAHPPTDSFRVQFLALWFVPGLLFYAIFHVGDPDHTLSIVPATCVIGAVVLAAVARNISRPKAALVIFVCVLLNVVFFFKPISKTARASSYKSVRWMDAYATSVIDGVRSMERDGPFTAVFHASMPAWRLISYYEPRTHLMILGTAAGRPATVRSIVGNQMLGQTSVAPNATFPVCGSFVTIDPLLRPPLGVATVWESPYPRLFFARSIPAQPFDFHDVRLISEAEGCPR